MIDLVKLVDYTDDYLSASRFRDYCPNGLQVEGRSEVHKLASGVTASMAFIEAALDGGADCLLVHHGYFWKNEVSSITGMKKRRLQALLGADVSLLAYHLPLDAHPIVGNNAQIAHRLGFSVLGGLQKNEKFPIGNVGELEREQSIDSLVERCEHVFGRAVTHVNAGPAQIRRIAWCTGAAQHMIEDAVALDVDVYLSGEISEQTAHVARECGIHYIAAGHHATERYGVQALGEHLADKFGLQHQFVDIDNPA